MPRGWRTSRELHEWRGEYDRCATSPCAVDLGGIPWSTCLSSDTPRAVATARALFQGPIEEMPLLREVQFAEFQTGGLRLPVFVWRWVLGLSWMTGHSSQRQARDEFRGRITAIANALEQRTGDVLVVSHAGVISYLSAELRRRRFAGPRLHMPENARLYLYQRREA